LVPLQPFQDVYDGVVLHLLAERDEAGLHNVYTLALHVRSADVYTLPREIEWRSCGMFFSTVVLMDAAVYSAVEAEINKNSQLELGGQLVHFSLDSRVEGFQPEFFADLEFVEAAPVSGSSWCRHHGGTEKSLGGLLLSSSSVADISRQLDCTKTLRWAVLGLAMNPHRLRDFDEVWPCPVRVVRHEDNLHIADSHKVLAGRSVILRVNLWADGLLTKSCSFSGVGPHHVPRGHDACEIELLVDEVLMDKSLATIIKGLDINLSVQSAQRSFAMMRPKRKGITAPIGPRTITNVKIGTLDASSARSLSYRWRTQQSSLMRPHRIEQIYNPLIADPLGSAFRDLRLLTTGQPVKHILVVDPFSLDLDALEAIVAVAASKPANFTLDIITKFQKPPKQEETTYEGRVQKFRQAVEHVAHELTIHVRVFNAVGISIHDRFLFVDERVFHVGPSFNALGEELGATVEMSDIRAIAELRKMLNPLLYDAVIETGSRNG